ncbi:hypothetical protein BDV32DRAFT_57919 [Aspergillus pseudonomiae]|uniref:Uncharacterized protein n=1 Tax=Aspergillus pseudonomiae TaxID=1506151 RepID=A0A5N7CZ61_9EURO|nr:uncharacterized protein BDV37DRAFT_260356 [Aspergillus pseudonomiae]KAB8259650.1 hypothetical protein BDV32DRAFT_57919 [Aspergillus pseudonomiae]KAE8399464.1 hypothetical protein BDV37DRAFT_260356 [Aspergillus pseudonomiae]
MTSMNAWVTPLVEDLLSRYIKGQMDSSEFVDDGSNLRFAHHSPQCTIVLNWEESEGRSVATLTDFKTQIEAVLANESLEALRREAGQRPLNRDITLNHFAQLLDYEIVLEYAMSAPKIHLYVRNLRIAWHKGKYKGAPQGKSIKKSARIRGFMKKVFETIKPRESHRAATSPKAYSLDDSPKSQTHDVSGNHVSQQFLQSQAQTSFVDSGVPSIMPVIQTRRSPAVSNALLGYLESHTKPADSGLPDNREHETVAISVNDEYPDRTEVRENIPEAAKSCSDIPRVEGAQESVSDSHSELIRLTPHNSHTASQARYDAGHELPTTETDGGKTGKIDVQHGQDHENITSSRSSPKQKLPETKHPSENSSSSHTDPWYGMTGIRPRDIRIPRNQVILLEQHTRQWVPPDHGDSIKGHVPPELLAQWNQIALQRSRLSGREGLGGFETERAESRELSPDINCSTAQTNAESDDEPVTSEWSESSPERVSRPRQLPADSSPVTGAIKKRNGVRITRPSSTREEKQPKEAGSTPVRENQRDRRATSAIQEDNDLPMKNSPFENSANEEHISRSVHNNTRAAGLKIQEESDAESEDSIMDTSVPCPLGGSQQSNFTNQSEQGIVSSGSSLPARGHVQVLETPLAYLRHLRSARLDKDKAGLESHDIERSSSQVAKSSSQSRIFNTYATNDNDIEGTQTTNASRIDEAGETNDIGILGTQMSTGDWSMPDATPNSHTALVFDSSAPKEHDSNAPIPRSTLESLDSSKPFSSHDEVISSMEFEEKGPELVPSQDLARDTHGHSEISSLKRPASNIEVEKEQAPSSKRHKFTQDEDIDAGIVGETRSASGLVSRRQDYIRHSAEHLEAQRIHEKFRNDYPSYVGDFPHFRKLCAILQAVRDKGSLQRSFLWDDFVIKHLEEYPHYLEQCLSLETKSLGYEDYFTSHFSKPTHKKRSLTAEGIKVVAAQDTPPDLSDAAVDLLLLRNGADTSFTTSLVDKFSNFHAHSFGPPTQSTQSDTDVDRMSFTMPSPTQHAKDKVRSPGDSQHPEVEEHTGETAEQRSEVEVQQPEAGEQHSEAEEQASEVDEQLRFEMNAQLSTLRNLDGNESVVAESEINSEEDGFMDETHETASIELGDEEPSTALEAPLSDNESEAANEAESPNENWFLSLRHLFPTKPSWCDDPDTPFKKWAQADQNVFSQRKFRRHWARIPTDEKGVLQLPYYSKPSE